MSFQAIAAPQLSSPSSQSSTILLPPNHQKPTSDSSTISIRRASLHDCNQIYNLLNDRQVAYWTAELPLVSLEALHEQIRQSTNHHFMLVACGGDQVIGTLTFAQYDKPRLRHVGRISQVVVHHTYRGRGIGTELMRSLIELADSWLNLKRLELLVYTDNDPAIHLYSKFGFISEGTLRQIAFRAGQYVDCLIMARVIH